MNLKRFRKLSAYDMEKTKKRDNFSFLNKNYCLEGQTVIAGDSITEIFNMELFDSYIEVTGLKVYNRGISGDTSDRLLERFDDNVLSASPRNIVLLIGTNDLTIKADVDYVLGNIKSIVEMSKSKLPDVNFVVQAVYPVEYKQKSKNAKIIELNSKIEQYCKAEGVAFADTYTPLLDDNGGFNKAYTYDGLHPNARGFEVVSKVIVEKLIIGMIK